MHNHQQQQQRTNGLRLNEGLAQTGADRSPPAAPPQATSAGQQPGTQRWDGAPPHISLSADSFLGVPSARAARPLAGCAARRACCLWSEWESLNSFSPLVIPAAEIAKGFNLYAKSADYKISPVKFVLSPSLTATSRSTIGAGIQCAISHRAN